VYDGDFSTLYGGTVTGGYNDNYSACEIISSHTFDTARDIAQIKVKARYRAAGYWYRTGIGRGFLIDILQSGTWNNIYNTIAGGGSTIPGRVDDSTLNYDNSTGWNCSGVRVYVLSSAEPYYVTSTSTSVTTEIYEIQAFYESPKIWVRRPASWKKVDSMYVREGGAWKDVETVNVMDSGVWK
jgi:hypothetical protein